MTSFRLGVVSVAVLVASVAAPIRGGMLQTPSPQESGAVTTGVREAAWSPDGKRLAVTWFDAIWTMSPAGKDARRLVNAPQGWASERDPAWSPDGKSIAFSVSTNGEFNIWVAPAGGGPARQLTSSPGDERWPSWAPNGRILYSARPPKGGWSLVMAPADGKGDPVRLTQGDVAEWQGRVSPHGKLIAFVSDREPQPANDADVWVRELDGTESRRVTRAPGVESHPVWAPDNARIAFAAPRQGAAGIYVTDTGATGSTGSAGATGAAGQRGRGGRCGGGAERGAGVAPAGCASLVPRWPDAADCDVRTGDGRLQRQSKSQ